MKAKHWGLAVPAAGVLTEDPKIYCKMQKWRNPNLSQKKASKLSPNQKAADFHAGFRKKNIVCLNCK